MKDEELKEDLIDKLGIALRMVRREQSQEICLHNEHSTKRMVFFHCHFSIKKFCQRKFF
ncbi:TPA: hypothetical protein ACGX3B_002374 [Enterococcus faecium]